MKYFFFFPVLFLLLVSCQGRNANQSPEAVSTTLAAATNSLYTPSAGDKIEVIDFHTTHRCQTCLKIENNTKALLASDFSQEMDKGQITFRTVNVDEEANFDMAEHFGAAGSALYLNVVKDGQQQHFDLTDFAFMKAFDEAAFSTELKATIQEKLKML